MTTTEENVREVPPLTQVLLEEILIAVENAEVQLEGIDLRSLRGHPEVKAMVEDLRKRIRKDRKDATTLVEVYAQEVLR